MAPFVDFKEHQAKMHCSAGRLKIDRRATPLLLQPAEIFPSLSSLVHRASLPFFSRMGYVTVTG
jgi:hypothetical protein